MMVCPVLTKRIDGVLHPNADAAIKEGNTAAAKLLYQQVGLLTDKVEVKTKNTGEVPDIDELKRMVAEMDE
ncbi:hypothetical protein C2W64_01776 [Brevibacillus laterosporus]|nr:hypothetical protein C2W64_01776 [Brevibacillus laterosporus]